MAVLLGHLKEPFIMLLMSKCALLSFCHCMNVNCVRRNCLLLVFSVHILTSSYWWIKCFCVGSPQMSNLKKVLQMMVDYYNEVGSGQHILLLFAQLLDDWRKHFLLFTYHEAWGAEFGSTNTGLKCFVQQPLPLLLTCVALFFSGPVSNTDDT